MVLLLVPDSMAFCTAPRGGDWEAAQWRWRLLGLAALVVCVVQEGRGSWVSRRSPIVTRARTASARE